MLKQILFFLLFLGFSCQAMFSTSNQVDSTGIKKVKELQQLSEKIYRKGDFELYKKYVDSLQILSKQYNLLEDEILAIVGQGIYYSNLDIYDQSLTKYLQALDKAKELPENSKTKIIVMANLGNIYNNLSQYEKASETFKKVIRLAKQHENPERILTVSYNALGITAMHQKKYEESLQYHKKVDSFATVAERNDVKIIALNNVADSYLKLEKYQNAIENASQALALFTKEESVESKANSHLHLGVANVGLNKPVKAIEALLIVKDIATENNFLKLEMHAHEYLARAYELKGNLQQSIDEHKKYIEVKENYLSTLSKGKRIIAERDLEEQKILFAEEKDVLIQSRKRIVVYASVFLVMAVLGVWIFFYKRKQKLRSQSESLAFDKVLLQNENKSLRDQLNEMMKNGNEVVLSKTTTDTSIKYQNSSMSTEDRNSYADQILRYMEEHKPYLNEDLKLSDFADALQMSVPQVSEVLNTCFQKNFNNFLNLYRINEVKELMKNPIYEEYKIVAIGYEAGFKSKTSFNRAFKNLVGLTPSEYRKQSA